MILLFLILLFIFWLIVWLIFKVNRQPDWIIVIYEIEDDDY